MYKSKAEENEEHWKFLLKENPLDAKLTEFDLSDAANFFMKSYSMQKIKKQEELDAKLEKERIERESKKRKADKITQAEQNHVTVSTFADDYVEEVDEINKKIELDTKMKKQVENKGKKPKLTFL